MHKYLIGYAAGVASTPLLLYVYRKHVVKGALHILADEKMDEPLYKLMSVRLDVQKNRQEQAEAE